MIATISKTEFSSLSEVSEQIYDFHEQAFLKILKYGCHINPNLAT
ncbi:hypothetical protein VB002_07200 [Campylobacter concisus]